MATYLLLQYSIKISIWSVTVARIKADDFQYMCRGQVVAPLMQRDVGVLSAVSREGTERDSALLLLHGFSSSPAVYRLMMPHLSMYDTVVCPLLPGHGESIQQFAKVTGQDWLQCAEEACHTLVQQYQRVDVLGLSLGGMLACHLSQRFPLHHLYLLAPSLVLKSSVPLLLAAAWLLNLAGVSRITNYGGSLYTSEHAELTYRQVPLKIVIEILRMIQDFQFVPPRCQTDVFLGRHDKVIDTKKVATWFANLPHAQVHWLAHSAHVLPLDGDVEVMLNCIRETHA